MSSSSCSSQLGISSFPDTIRFKDVWRDYQARVLDRLDEYLSDDRVHIIAAPGSGKTVLGWEIIRRINRPTLILAPTLTIREQWVSRFLEHFTDFGYARPAWISTDLDKPAFLTLVTYQAWHHACSSNGEPSEAAAALASESELEDGDRRAHLRMPLEVKNVGFGTLVVDEAHHLRSEWWKSIQLLVAELDKPIVVALTATPPLDVTPYEWERYQELCGPVDAQVSIPELVLKKDLCPHQDYVFFTCPSTAEETAICGFHERITAFVTRLRANSEFAESVCKHPWLQSPEANAEEILEQPEVLSSMLIYVNAAGHEVPEAALKLLGVEAQRFPELNLEWLELLLTFLLYRDQACLPDQLAKTLRRELLGIGAIERQRVKLRDSADFMKLLTTSTSKLPAIAEIVQLESESLDDDLRLVILTDFIRKSELPDSDEDDPISEDIGVVPIFEELRRRKLTRVRLCILSGSLVVVPSSSAQTVSAVAREFQIREDDLLLTPMAHDTEYCKLSLRGSNANVVGLITELFARGHFNVLIGTKSLLGEGWDAPCINTLVLASFVGSYMLSNQMRGRAIRVDKNSPQKTANIWHLVCVEPGLFGPGGDLDLLERRFASFCGLQYDKPVIASGIGRLGLGKPPYSHQALSELNERMMNCARDRTAMRRQWEAALGSGQLMTMTEGLETPEAVLPRGFIFGNTIAAIAIEGILVAYIVWELMAGSLRLVRFKSSQDFLVYLLIVASIMAAASLPFFLGALWRWLRHGSIESSIKQVGKALLRTLWQAGLIDSDASKFRVYADRNPDGSVYCWIGGGSLADQHTFLDCLRDVLNPVENPRYLLCRSPLWRLFREDYFPVPDELGRKKEWAEMFAKQWNRCVGYMVLVYTRTEEGRKLLLRARFHSLSSRYQPKAERLSCWK
jgi:superfamily II DNA or RNA helicase